MGNLNFNKISIIIAIFAISAFVVSLLPILFYYFTFKDNAISKIPSDWGTFGDFLSGTSGIVLSFLAVIFSLVSIYLTIRIAKYIQDNEFKYKDAQSKNDLQLIYTQSKPFPYIDLGKLPNETYVTLQNMGLGPLIIKEISILYKKNKQFENFFQLLSAELHISTVGAQIIYNSAPTHILAPNNSKSIFQVIPEKDNIENYLYVQNVCKNILKDCEIVLIFEDMFKNEDKYSKDLTFFNE